MLTIRFDFLHPKSYVQITECLNIVMCTRFYDPIFSCYIDLARKLMHSYKTQTEERPLHYTRASLRERG